MTALPVVYEAKWSGPEALGSGAERGRAGASSGLLLAFLQQAQQR